LIAKCLAAYFAAQVPNEKYVRSHPAAPGHISGGKSGGTITIHPSASATSLYQQLEGLKGNKLYAGLKEHVEFAVEFLTAAGNGLREAVVLVGELVERLYPEVHYLAVLRPRKPELL
jgi:hypothetical protein